MFARAQVTGDEEREAEERAFLGYLFPARDLTVPPTPPTRERGGEQPSVLDETNAEMIARLAWEAAEAETPEVASRVLRRLWTMPMDQLAPAVPELQNFVVSGPMQGEDVSENRAFAVDVIRRHAPLQAVAYDAQGISATWPGMKTPKSMQVKRTSDPGNRHFEKM